MAVIDHEYSLAGEVAFVTGSGRGLGHAIARRLAELGAAVVVHDRTEDAPAEFGEFADIGGAAADVARLGHRTCTVVGDIADEARVAAMVAEAERALGPVTLLVNAAGGDIAAKGGKPHPNTALGIKMEDVRALVDRNLIGTMLMCRAVVPAMIERRQGAVVNILSVNAHGGGANLAAYSASKGALATLTKNVANAVLNDRIRINGIYLGWAETPGEHAIIKSSGQGGDDWLEKAESSQPVGRLIQPDEVARLIGFLASGESGVMTGAMIDFSQHVAGTAPAPTQHRKS